MISFSGYGIFLVVGIYAASFLGASKTVPAGASRMTQVVAILIICLLSTVVNYALARFLNRHERRHTVCGAKLETVVLALGAVLLFLASMMLYGELKG